MQTVTKEQVIAALVKLGVRAGDGLLVHSAIQYLGQPIGGVGMYLHALLEVLDAGTQRGTIVVPSFNFGFARGEPFDPQTTPAQGMGVFSETVRQHPQARRTRHPMQSLAVLGRDADDLASRDTPSAFDPGSAFERMLELDYKLLLLGADVQAVSMLHYSEQRTGVPYRYWKGFTGQVKQGEGWQNCTYRMYVRNLTLDPQIELYPVQARLVAHGQWSSVRLNYGEIAVCRLADFVAGVDGFLNVDPWSLVVNRPASPSQG